MKNKLITKIDFKIPREPSISLSDEILIISEVSFSWSHEQECCENVFADFSNALEFKEQIKKLGKITQIEVKNVEEMGFIIFVSNGDGLREGILINCYNQQNGYYSSNLDITIYNKGNKIGTFDVEKKDNID